MARDQRHCVYVCVKGAGKIDMFAHTLFISFHFIYFVLSIFNEPAVAATTTTIITNRYHTAVHKWWCFTRAYVSCDEQPAFFMFHSHSHSFSLPKHVYSLLFRWGDYDDDGRARSFLLVVVRPVLHTHTHTRAHIQTFGQTHTAKREEHDKEESSVWVSENWTIVLRVNEQVNRRVCVPFQYTRRGYVCVLLVHVSLTVCTCVHVCARVALCVVLPFFIIIFYMLNYRHSSKTLLVSQIVSRHSWM